MNKATAIILALLMALSLSGCSSITYNNACEKMNKGEYSEAKAIFDTIPEYEDSSTKSAKCQYELGLIAMEAYDYETAKAYFDAIDYEDSKDLAFECSFLIDFEKSVISRCEQANDTTDSASVETLINQEIFQLKKYYGKLREGDFQVLLDCYYEGLDDQLSYCHSPTLNSQVDFFFGGVVRYRCINTLYERYGLFRDNNDVYLAYIAGMESREKEYERIDAIASSINAWRRGIGQLRFGTYTVRLPDYYNDTDYTFNLQTAVTPYDTKGVKYVTYYQSFNNINPGDTICLDLSLSCTNTSSCDLEFYIAD